MAEYQAPLRDMQFVVNEVNALDQLAEECGYTTASSDLASAIFEEAAKFTSGVLSPLNRIGDEQPARWEDGNVYTPPGWKDAYQQFCSGGWNGLSLPEEYGGQGLPSIISAMILEMVTAANMSFGLGPLLTTGSVNALLVCASEEIKTRYLPKMVSGEWAGTMNLTEPQAGSDLAAVRTKAEPQADGTYKITGQKIFITYGDHDMTDNIIHLVLARLPDAPAGVKGISLFLVPKFMVQDDGGLGALNDVRCVSIEHKLGIHGSPTCVLAFGDHGGATGYLLGEANRGLQYMFVMMNEARFGVGIQGIALGDRAAQQALQYAHERTQGRDIATGSNNAPIIQHPDVARLYHVIRVQVDAGRLIAAHTAALMDRAHALTGEAASDALYRAELLIPIVKGWNTEKGIENTSHAMQMYGGMGYIEETGATQYFRDVRITTIYEGTTAIQANDLLGRKLGRDGCAALKKLVAEMRATANSVSADAHISAPLSQLPAQLISAAQTLENAALQISGLTKENIKEAYTGAVPFLMGMGDVCGAWLMLEAAQVAQRQISAGNNPEDKSFYQQKINHAVFYYQHILPHGLANLQIASAGASLMPLM